MCNSGVSLIPTIDGQLHHFEYVGLYNGLALVRDVETNSYWSHYTGECIHGQYQGSQLDVVATVQHMTAAQALAHYPHAEIALAKQGFFARFFSRLMQMTTLTPKGSIPPHFYKTMGDADDRRQRMDLGLGVWTETLARYYPLETIKVENAIIDELDGQGLVVYIDPASQTPTAIYAEPSSTHWENDELHLDTTDVIRHGRVYKANGEETLPQRPHQQFTRWYGFSYTFPNCEIYTG